jgi:hypothetical protein
LGEGKGHPKFQMPISKSQISSKFQCPNLKHISCLGHSDLDIGAYLEIGAWNLGFSEHLILGMIA